MSDQQTAQSKIGSSSNARGAAPQVERRSQKENKG